MKVNSFKELKKLSDGNKFLGHEPELVNTSVEFKGKNNILFCDEKVKLVNSSIVFNGDNSIVFLSSNKHDYKLSVFINNDSVFFMGKDNYINGTLNVILSERKHCFVGNNCLFSFGIWVRNADPHLIYDSISKKRVNPTRSVFIGDHVWLGQSAMLLKGTQIDSGSIIGAMSAVSGKKIKHNSVYAGNPVHFVKKNVFWNESCVHKWDSSMTKKNSSYGKMVPKERVDDFIYKYDKDTVIEYSYLDKLFDSSDKDNILDELIKLKDSNDKNRFVHKIKRKCKFARKIKTFLDRLVRNRVTRKIKRLVKKVLHK